MKQVAVIGAGPAGLMAADVLSARGVKVTVFEAKPSVARKFLMAGKSGLNLTKSDPMPAFVAQYAEASEPLSVSLNAFGPDAVQAWAQKLGQEVFTGSTGRVFPKAMKASPLLRAWLSKLADQDVDVRTRACWRGWDGNKLTFDTPEGRETVQTDAVVLALGGASWARLGSDGAWAKCLAERGVDLRPFQPANFGLLVNWSVPMHRHFGTPLKGVCLTAGEMTSRGEVVISARGLEGGGLYEVSRAVRAGAPLIIDLLPQFTIEAAAERLLRPKGKASLSNHLRKVLKLEPAKIALAQECARPLPQSPHALAACLKALELPHDGPRPMDEAISTAGGVAFDALTPDLMLHDLPGVFCAGEMLDWEAPTGGYLITACFATGRTAAQGVLRYLDLA